jgi:hypothetical protein
MDCERVAWASLDERELVSQVEQVSNDSRMDGLKLEVWFASSCYKTLVNCESSLDPRFLLLAVPRGSGVPTEEAPLCIVFISCAARGGMTLGFRVDQVTVVAFC